MTSTRALTLDAETVGLRFDMSGVEMNDYDEWARSRPPGRHTLSNVKLTRADAEALTLGLTLMVREAGSRQWSLRFRLPNGERVERGLGGYPTVGVDAAAHAAVRERLRIEAEYVAEHGDDSTARRAAEAHIARANAADERRANLERPAGSFAAVARQKLDTLLPTWRNAERDGREWWNSLTRHASPLMGLEPADITTADVLEVLEPIWHDKPATAQRVRQRIRSVLGYAMALDETIARNAAGDALDGALPRQRRRVAHHAALPADGIADALTLVCARKGDNPPSPAVMLCIRLVALTAVRSREAREARWAEIEGDVWTIPAERMKSGREHRVPLSRQALDVLAEARKLDDGSGYVFPSPQQTERSAGRPLADNTMRNLWRDAGVGGTVHGLRSSFRDWALKQPGVSFEAAERALAHSVGSTVTQAYMRDDLLDERRALMAAWADYVAGS